MITIISMKNTLKYTPVATNSSNEALSEFAAPDPYF